MYVLGCVEPLGSTWHIVCNCTTQAITGTMKTACGVRCSEEEHLPGMSEVLGSNPHTTEGRNKGRVTSKNHLLYANLITWV